MSLRGHFLKQLHRDNVTLHVQKVDGDIEGILLLLRLHTGCILQFVLSPDGMDGSVDYELSLTLVASSLASFCPILNRQVA